MQIPCSEKMGLQLNALIETGARHQNWISFIHDVLDCHDRQLFQRQRFHTSQMTYGCLKYVIFIHSYSIDLNSSRFRASS